VRAALADRLHARLGAAVFRGAVDDIASGRVRRSRLSRFTVLLAIVILALPFVLLAGGTWLLAFDFPNLLTIASGATLIWAGWTLVPRRDRPRPGLLTRAELPAFFGLLDRVARALGTETPEALFLASDFNASMRRTVLARQRRAELEIGLTLWAALKRDEKAALLAHELAHAHHGDSARATPVYLALGVLEDWIHLWSPVRAANEWGMKGDYGEGPGSAVGAAIAAVLAALADGASYMLERLDFLDSQRAEYHADAAAVRVAGAAAVIRLLQKLSVVALVERELGRLGDGASRQGAAIFAKLAAPARMMGSPEAQAELRRMQAESLRIASTHPPTRFRIGFIEVLGPVEPAVDFTEAEAAAIERELVPHADAVAAHLVAALERQ
jgi:Zn-dependent protease with chaperone function